MLRYPPLLLVGGNANNGANCGPFYGNWNNAASNSNWNYAGWPLHAILRIHAYVRSGI